MSALLQARKGEGEATPASFARAHASEPVSSLDMGNPISPIRLAPSILALDPGTLESGWVVLTGREVTASGIDRNDDVLHRVAAWPHALAIEMIASYGMPVGREVFETCVWIGRFVQAYRYSSLVQLIYRKDVKTHLCGTSQARDPHIRQALIDLLGPQGTKKAPGPTYGVRSHAWAALGVGATALKLTRHAMAPGLFGSRS